MGVIMEIEDYSLKMSEKDIALQHLEHCKEAYIKTNNPVHVWRGYCEYRTAEIDLPEWIQNYLDTCAKNIAVLSIKKHPEIDQKVSRSEICDAFNLKESFVTKFHKESTPIYLCCKVYPYLLQDVSLEYATYHASDELKKGMSQTRLRYAWVDQGHNFIELFSKYKECATDSHVYKAFELCSQWDEIKSFFKNSPSF